MVNLFDPSIASGFATNDFNGSIGDPEWVGDATIQLRRGDFTYSWFIDYIGPTDNRILGFAEVVAYFGRQGRRIITTDDWLSHDVSVRWRGDNVVVTGGVANVFDAPPPVITTGAGSASAATTHWLRNAVRPAWPDLLPARGLRVLGSASRQETERAALGPPFLFARSTI